MLINSDSALVIECESIRAWLVVFANINASIAALRLKNRDLSIL